MAQSEACNVSNVEVVGSKPTWSIFLVYFLRARGAIASVSALQAGGSGIETHRVHRSCIKVVVNFYTGISYRGNYISF